MQKDVKLAEVHKEVGGKGMLKCSEDMTGTKIRVPAKGLGGGRGSHWRQAAWHWNTFVKSLGTWCWAASA